MSCCSKCHVTLPHGAGDWSAVCACGISCSYLLFGLYVMLLYPSENLNEIISFHKLLNRNQIVTPRTLMLMPTTAPTESWSLCVDNTKKYNAFFSL